MSAQMLCPGHSSTNGVRTMELIQCRQERPLPTPARTLACARLGAMAPSMGAVVACLVLFRPKNSLTHNATIKPMASSLRLEALHLQNANISLTMTGPPTTTPKDSHTTGSTASVHAPFLLSLLKCPRRTCQAPNAEAVQGSSAAPGCPRQAS